MKYVYLFGNGQADGTAEMKNLLGGKGANLAEMNHLGIPVPPGFTITTVSVPIIMKMIKRSLMSLKPSSLTHFKKQNRSWEPNSGMSRIHYWSLFDPGPGNQCRE